jgi:membrane protease YdiL (CAAX protease family)
MLGITFLLILSSVLAFFIYGKKWDVLDIVPTKKRMLYFFIGFLLVSVLCLLTLFIESLICSIKWKINQPIDFFLLRRAIGYYFIAALTEELVFRGFLLYVLAKTIKVQNAKIISAVCFGFYHLFSYEMFGAGIIPMAYIFIITGLAGYVWSCGYIKSGTIWLALGMHFSWNMIQSLFSGKTPYGSILYNQISKTELSDLNNLFLSLFTGIFPSVIMYLGLYFFFNRKKN